MNSWSITPLKQPLRQKQRVSAVAGTGLTPGRRLAFGLKRRVAAGATSLMMIVGMTGVAWASDSAVPGDWNYGIDRALEAVGIGAGGAAERLQELAAIRENGHPSGAESAPQTGPTTPPDVGGLENAAATVAEIIGGSSACQRCSDRRVSIARLSGRHRSSRRPNYLGASPAIQASPPALTIESARGEPRRTAPARSAGRSRFRQSSLDRPPIVTRQGAAGGEREDYWSPPSDQVARGHEPR